MKRFSRQQQRAQRAARAAALRERIRLGNVDDYRLEVFDVIAGMGIWLMFQPLSRLYGFYQRIDDVAGIVVHAGHPTALQRYTAAHEYGHYSLGHLDSFDGQAEIEGGAPTRADPLQEAEAQAFAGALLMPLHLVRRACVDLDIDAASLSPLNLYNLALRFGVSYRAMRTQMWVYRLIDFASFLRLDLSPLEIKKQLGDGSPPADHRAELWVIGEDKVPNSLPLQIADEVIIRVTELPSTGYRWRVGCHPRPSLELVADWSHKADGEGRLGGRRTRSLRFRALKPGQTKLHLGLSRAFTPDREIQSLDVEVVVAPPVTGGIFGEQLYQLVDRRT